MGVRLLGAAVLAALLPALASAQAPAPPGPPPPPFTTERDGDTRSLRAVDAEQWDDALALTLALVQQYGEKPAYLSRLATIYNRMHRPSDEVAQWERFMAVSPRPGQACPMIGKAYRGLGQYEQAVDALTRCLAADPGNALLVYYVGLGYEWAGDFTPARAYYTRAVEMAPPGFEARVSLARVDLHENALAAARDGAVSVLAQVPTHVEAALVAGLAEQRAGRRAEARRHLELAAKLSPDYFDVRLALGILDFTENRVAAARSHFEAAFLADPGRRADVQPWLDRTAAPK
jgi:tetratricopeptide (TPR) repeat protein